MTKTEQASIDQLSKIATTLQSTVNTLHERVEILQSSTEKKFEPVNLEKQIAEQCSAAVFKSIESTLVAYNSPFVKIIAGVIDANSAELKSLVDNAFKSVIRTEDFKNSIVSAFSHKIARNVISNNTGLFDKVTNDLKNDPAFRARMTIAVANVVEECLKKDS